MNKFRPVQNGSMWQFGFCTIWFTNLMRELIRYHCSFLSLAAARELNRAPRKTGSGRHDSP